MSGVDWDEGGGHFDAIVNGVAASHGLELEPEAQELIVSMVRTGEENIRRRQLLHQAPLEEDPAATLETFITGVVRQTQSREGDVIMTDDVMAAFSWFCPSWPWCPSSDEATGTSVTVTG